MTKERSSFALPGSFGIGTRVWGDRFRWGYGEDFTEDDLTSAFRIATDAGVAFFDTAEIYARGQSEVILGKFIRESSSGVLVATKYAPFPWRFGRKAILKALQSSLQRLEMNQVDLYQIHWPYTWVSIESLADGLADAVDAGLTKWVGVSNFNAEQMKRAHEVLSRRGITLVSNQVKYSLIHRKPETSHLLDTCREMRVTLIAYSPIAMGALTGKYTLDHPPLDVRRRRFNEEFLVRLQPLLQRMREIGKVHGGKTPAQVAVKWIIAKGAFPIPGVKNARQMEEITGVYNWSLTDSEVDDLDTAAKNFEDNRGA
ncbi:MAG: aldo/keto reductase [Anaerolineales bacterium]|nr:aldo/keto reductase [Anaerolineales bacterium]